jgi:hypothetical protein
MLHLAYAVKLLHNSQARTTHCFTSSASRTCHRVFTIETTLFLIYFTFLFKFFLRSLTINRSVRRFSACITVMVDVISREFSFSSIHSYIDVTRDS